MAKAWLGLWPGYYRREGIVFAFCSALAYFQLTCGYTHASESSLPAFASYPGETRLLEEGETETISMVGVWEGTYITTEWKFGTLSVTVRQDGGEYTAEVQMTNTEGNSITPVPLASGKLIDKEFAVNGTTPAPVTDAKWASIDIAMSGEVAGDVWSGTLTRQTVVESRLTLDTLSGQFKLERSRSDSLSTLP